MSERQGLLVRNGLLVSGAFAVLLLLMLFYSTVSGAVDRAARHRAEGMSGARSTGPAGLAQPRRSVVALDKSAT